MTDYIGAKLSLISKSDIRYVGILHEIDSANSTVSLENVRSFGTEGRKSDPALEIPASDNVFEYIIFRGSDVKDLRVEQSASQPQQPAPRQAVPDPAIVQAAPQAPSNARNFQEPPAFAAPPSQQAGYGYGYAPAQQIPSQGHKNGPSQAQFKPSQNQGPFAPQPHNAFPDLPSSVSKSSPMTSQAAKEGSMKVQPKVVPALPLPQAIAPAQNPQNGMERLTSDMSGLDTQTKPAKRNALLEANKAMKPAPKAATPASTSRTQPVAESAPQHHKRSHSPSASRRDPGVRQNGVIVNPEAAVIIPKEEYDFTTANAAFEKEKQEASAQGTKPVYNKKSSFFDDISSEATDRSIARSQPNESSRGRGRELRNAERSMNYETFGEDLAFRSRGRGRGKGRGRGRGSARGRGSDLAV